MTPLLLAVALAVAAVDQFTKWLVAAYLPLNHPVDVLGSSFRFSSVRNYGGALGLMPHGSHYLAIVAVIFVAAVLVFGSRYPTRSRLVGWGVCLLLGGALGNLIDRVRLGYVVDFLDIRVWPVFNVADMAVVIGAALIVLKSIISPGRAPWQPVSQNKKDGE